MTTTTNMKHPLECPKCGEFRYIEYEGVRFEDDKNNKGFGVNVPIFKCKS
jgi:hypothetical protein